MKGGRWSTGSLVVLVWGTLGAAAAGCGGGEAQVGPSADARVADDRKADGPDGGMVADLGQADLRPVPRVHRVPLLLGAAGVFLHAHLDGKGPLLMRYDTGAPFTYLRRRAATELGIAAGPVEAAIGSEVLGTRRIEIIDRPPEGPYPDISDELVLGTVGNDFFAGHSVGLDYRGRELWLVPTQDPGSELPRPAGTVAPVVAGIERPLGYLVVSCSFGDTAPTRNCLFDTGSIDSVSMQAYWLTLDHPSERTVPTFSFDVEGNRLEGYYQRTSATRAGQLRQAGDYVAVFEHFAVLQEIAGLIGREIVGLVGVVSTLAHYTVVDYGNDRLLLFPYQDLSHLPPSPFVGLGFVVTSNQNMELEVLAVVPRSQAEGAGVREGDILLEIDGVPWWQVPQLEISEVGLIVEQPGTSRILTMLRGAEPLVVEVVAEDLLPVVP